MCYFSHAISILFNVYMVRSVVNRIWIGFQIIKFEKELIKVYSYSFHFYCIYNGFMFFKVKTASDNYKNANNIHTK